MLPSILRLFVVAGISIDSPAENDTRSPISSVITALPFKPTKITNESKSVSYTHLTLPTNREV